MTADELDPRIRLVRRGGLIESEVHGEVIALDIDQGQCYGLNSVGSRVWQLLESPVSLEEMVDTLTSEYEVSRAECLAQVGELVSSLKAAGLLTTA